MSEEWYSEGDYFDDLEAVDEDPSLLNEETYEALKRINDTHASMAAERPKHMTVKCPTCGVPHEEDGDEKDDEHYRNLERHMGLKLQLKRLEGEVLRLKARLGEENDEDKGQEEKEEGQEKGRQENGQ